MNQNPFRGNPPPNVPSGFNSNFNTSGTSNIPARAAVQPNLVASTQPQQHQGNPFTRSPLAAAPVASTAVQVPPNANANAITTTANKAAAFAFETPAPKQPIQESPDAPLPPFSIGMAIDSDRIKLLDFVGQGSFAHVYLGYDYSTSQKCAVKCLMKAGADPKKMAMQKREVNAMEDLNGHPNVIRLIRTVDTQEWLLIVMEFCQIDLYEAIMQKGGFPDFAVKDVFSQLCDGVMHCHSRGYYHRDLKPENILLDVNSLTAKITDFGLATRDTWCYEMGCGSTRYIPPEACATADPTKGYSPIASDVWALGILLVNLLFSKNPWFEATMSDPIFSIYVTSRPDILRHHFKISAEFDSILSRVFSLDPSKRLPLPEFKKLVNALPSFLEEDLENTVPQQLQLPTEPAQYQQQHIQQQQVQQVPQQSRPTPVAPLPQQKGFNPFGSAKNSLGSGRNAFGSSKMQGPLVVFGSIPDAKYTQDPRNPFNSNPRASPMNFTTTDFNPFSSANAFSSQTNNGSSDESTDQELVNPFFSIPADGTYAISPSAHLLDPQFASPQYQQHWPQNVQPPSPTLPPVVVPNPSLTTLIWTAPARVAAPELPNTLTLGREGIGRIGISRLATAKQKLSSRRGLHNSGDFLGGGGHHHHHQSTATSRPAFGLAFLGTAIAGYVNPDSESDEIFEGDEYDDNDLDNEDLDGVEGDDVNRSAPDEESHYEVVKVDRRLIPDLEKGIKRAVNRGMKKFRPFMQLGGGTPSGQVGGGAGELSHGVDANLKLGKDVAGNLGPLSTEDWSEFSTNGAVSGSGNQVTMPGAFVFATERERRKSMPLLPQHGGGGKVSSDTLNLPADLPVYNDSGRSPRRGGNSHDDLSREEEGGIGGGSSEDEVRNSRSRRRHNGETVLSKVYNGLAGMSILGGSRSKSLKRISETRGNSHHSLPLHSSEISASILPAPQAPFAFMVAKNAKSRVSEKDFEDMVVNAKTSIGSIPQAAPRHRLRVKNKPSMDDSVNNNNSGGKSGSLTNPNGFSASLPDFDEASSGRPSSVGGQFSPDNSISPNRLSLGRLPAPLEGTSPNRISLSRPVHSDSSHFLVTTPVNMYPPAENSLGGAEQLVNPFRPLNPANPFQPQQPQQQQQHPVSMYQYQTSNPFQPQLNQPAIPMDTHQQQQYQRQQPQQYNQNRHSTPLSNTDVNILLGGAYGQQPVPTESPFKPLPFQHQQPLQQHQQNTLHNQASLPNMSLYRSTTPFADNGLLNRTQLPRATPTYPLDDDEISGGIEAGGEESDEDLDDGLGRRGGNRQRAGEDRYVRGLVRGFGWLVGSGRDQGNNVERSDSHGV
ncbi:UNVERIFIED_CONTAM: hypothetical protein HDU68_009022 [Siphonaria sp. JEL0065]|nr:hypothetical protein HDU68_009022 [Siphonaria sp. JEL0065]